MPESVINRDLVRGFFEELKLADESKKIELLLAISGHFEPHDCLIIEIGRSLVL
jgi:hypothetical protein